MVAPLAPQWPIRSRINAPPETLSLRAFGVAFPLLLLGYAFADRALAWVHVPGTPIFIGEAVLGLGVLAIATDSSRFTEAWRGRICLIPLLAFCAWGFAMTVFGYREFGLTALRDGALWYYAIAAFLVVGLISDDVPRLTRWVEVYRRVLPYLLLWLPFALLFGKILPTVPGPAVPGSVVPVLDHKPGNVAVQASIALAFIWLVPDPQLSQRRRVTLTTAAIIIALVAGTQTRGGFVAAALAGLLAFLMHRDRLRHISGTVAVLVLLVAVAWGTNLRLSTGSDRDVSVAQFTRNLSTLLNGGSSSNSADPLVGNIEFREKLWTHVLSEMRDENRVLTGLGFGPNLAAASDQSGSGAGSLAEPDLRSPHNSHIDVFARMGLVGAVIWVTMWCLWFGAVMSARASHWRAGRQFESGVCATVVVGVAATLCNAFFDPTLEGAQAAFWLWALFGLGVALVPRHGSLRLASR